MPILRRRGQSPTTAQRAGGSAVPGQRATPEATHRETETRPVARPAYYGRAGTLMTLSGMLTFFAGITGVIRGIFFNTVAAYPFYFSVRGRGVTLLVIGAVAFVTGLALLIRVTRARHVATVVAMVSAVANFMFLPFYPLWSIVVLTLDVIIIWDLTRDRGSRELARLPQG